MRGALAAAVLRLCNEAVQPRTPKVPSVAGLMLVIWVHFLWVLDGSWVVLQGLVVLGSSSWESRVATPMWSINSEVYKSSTRLNRS